MRRVPLTAKSHSGKRVGRHRAQRSRVPRLDPLAAVSGATATTLAVATLVAAQLGADPAALPMNQPVPAGEKVSFAAPSAVVDAQVAVGTTTAQQLGLPQAGPADPARAFSAARALLAPPARAATALTAPARARSQAAAARAQKTASRSARAARDPRVMGRALAAEKGWTGRQFACLDALWTKESDWTVTADNPTSSAYGIPQALPGKRMASEGKKWATDAETQIRWGLKYIDERYSHPCNAWAHSHRVNWY